MNSFLRAITFCVFLISAVSYAQKSKLDSIYERLATFPRDTNMVKEIIAIAKDGVDREPTIAIELLSKAQSIASEISWTKGLEQCYYYTGVLYYYQSEFTKALEKWIETLKLRELLGEEKEAAAILANIGLLYWNLDENEKALDYMTRGMKASETLGDISRVASAKGNIGMVYFKIKNYTKALEYFYEAMKIAQEQGYYNLEKNTVGNIGVIYLEQKKYSQAKSFFLQSLSLHQKSEESIGVSRQLGNIGCLYVLAPELAFEEGRSKKGLALAEEYLAQALHISKQLRVLSLISEQEDFYHKLEMKRGNWKLALERYKNHVLYRDSIINQENKKAQLKKELQYEYGKKAAADSVAFEKQDEIRNALVKQQEAEIRAKKNQQFGLGIILILVLMFSFFLFNRFRITNKQKKIIELQKELVEKQKHMVEEKNQEILDSISYAKRIQSAILPPIWLVKEHLPYSFILYKPKDIVAGDFYWLESKDGKVFFSAADCTGHGVPGAMVSVFCNNGLNRSVREHGLTDPGQILDKAREIVIQEFEKSDEEVKDGMDISLCAFNPKTKTIEWAGANNPLWIIRKDKLEIEEIKANKQPIGKYTEPKPFTTHSFKLQEGDSIYIFTDGYQDQFGGEKGKKFKASKMKELLLSIQHLGMEEQRELINSTFESWKGDLEQVDDVCVIGVKI